MGDLAIFLNKLLQRTQLFLREVKLFWQFIAVRRASLRDFPGVVEVPGSFRGGTA